MNPTLVNSLWITLLSMSIVFAALLLLAGLMSAMTRVFRDREETLATLAPEPSPSVGGEQNGKMCAAAIAVAVALAEQEQSTAHPITPPQPSIVGAWQLGMRTRQMTQKGESSRRGK
ncbi:MAG: OadG family protein [Chloroflexi bacterium]|nr:OadG family protein [Chloroflexota bacterium]